MRKREKQIYKSGKNNPNGYKFKRYIFIRNKKVYVYIYLFIVLVLATHFLEVFGVLSYNKLHSSLNSINGVKKQESEFSVYYLDVGQSDCTIVTCDGKVLMIDTGTVNQVHKIRESLFSLEVNTIDYMVITHQHDDHMAGASQLMDEYEIKNVVMPKLSSINSVDSLTYQDLINKIAVKSIKPIAVSAGDAFMLGTAKVEILSPIKQDKNLNNMSVVIKITYGDTEFLFQGDSESTVEKQILRSGADIDVDVIKIGHHGSNTSTSDSYIDAVSPQYAIVSAGIKNDYGHPSFPVIDRLHQNNVEIYSTSYNGNIIVNSDGNNISIIKEYENDLFSLE